MFKHVVAFAGLSCVTVRKEPDVFGILDFATETDFNVVEVPRLKFFRNLDVVIFCEVNKCALEDSRAEEDDDIEGDKRDEDVFDARSFFRCEIGLS